MALIPIGGLLRTRSSLVHSNSESFDAIHTHHPHPTIKHPQTYIIPGWVDTQVFKPTGPKNEEFTVLFSGRALWQKGWDIYVSLAKKMKDSGMRFVYVGGAVKDEIIHSLGFQGNMLALSRIYNSSHVLMDPVRADTFGRVAVESMACGTPVVTTPSPSHRELNLPFVFGNSLDDYAASVRHLRALWEAGSPYSRLSQQCTSAANTFDFKNTVTQYEKMFFEVLHAN